MKKKIIGFVGAALFLGGLYVNQAQGASVQEAYNQAVVIACDSSKDLGYDIMIVRQTPITVDEQIQMIKDVGVEKKYEDNAIKIVREAHKVDVVIPELVNITATDFGYKIQEKCLKDLSGTIL